MIPNVGDVYCVYVEKLQQYTACQVIGLKETEGKPSDTLASVLQLNWTGDQLPNEMQLHQMEPLICNFYFWNDRLAHRFVSANVPSQYVLAGNIPPLYTEETNTYGGGWPIGESLYLQREWESIDAIRRVQFKQAADDDKEVMVGDRVMRRSTSTLRDFRPTSAEDVAELAQLPCLTHIEMDGYTESIFTFIEDNPIINELHILHHGQTMMDISKSHLTKLIVDVSGLKELILNTKIRSLNFTGELSPDLRIVAYEDGKCITLNVPSGLPQVTGISRLEGLYIRDITELNLDPLVQYYPELSELRLWGKPGNVSHIESIQHLANLQTFTTYDLFGFKCEQFPDPEQLPKLTTLWLTSLPADAAKSIKTRYKKFAAAGLDMEITKARKPEWLAENLNNPFRDWDGRDHIKAAHAKKATQLYKQCLKEIRQLSQDFNNQEAMHKQLVSMVENYTQTFNKMDAKTGFIETVEREEIYVVLTELLDQLQQHLELRQDDWVKVNHEELYEVFDRLRDF
ncbi:DUF3450 domain-containing protein [Paenibacillus amylolyticus]|uniref:DUF3450 domain-containing protein n=1 Tax=Paenibacillus amylolyticus TaxID=1451 RepID=UPI00201DEEDD|nr:DUF3450 domain-containing protein [Paenibacillus amylolyticus]MCL6661600.1 DUF3450 domain-containing protein [Paenibacillus amylolyticus]